MVSKLLMQKIMILFTGNPMKGKMMRKLKVDLTKYHRWFIRWSKRNITEEDCLNEKIEDLYVMLSDWLDLMAIPIDRKLMGQEIVFPVNAEHQDEITYDTFLEGCRIIKGKVTKVTSVQICVNGKFYDYAEGKVVFDKLEYCILSLVYDGDMLFQGNMMDSIYPDNLIDIDESVGITKEEIFV